MNTAPSLEPRQARSMLVVLFAAAFVATYNENIINMALVSLMEELRVDAVTSQWLVSGYMVVSTLLVVVTSFLFRRVRLRPLFFFATGMLTVSSLLAFFAPTFPLLLALRLLQALGAGILIPAMMNSILLVAPRQKLGTYMAVGACMITFGPALAPVLSGVMVTMLGWRFVFVPVVVGSAAVLAAGAALVRNANPVERLQADPASVAMAAAGLFALVYGMSVLTTQTALGVAGLAVAAALIALFAVRQVREKASGREPLLDLTPMRSASFFPACFLVMICMMCTFSSSVLLPLFYEGAIGMSSMAAGMLLLVPVLVNAVVGLFAGRIEDTHGEWPLLPAGIAVCALGMAIETAFGPALAVPGVLAGSVLVFGGVGAVMSPSQTAGLKTLPRELNTAGVSLLNVFIQVAACVAPSLFIGVMSGTQAALTAELGASAAGGAGLSRATLIACALALVGFVLAFVYARSLRRKAGRRVTD